MIGLPQAFNKELANRTEFMQAFGVLIIKLQIMKNAIEWISAFKEVPPPMIQM